jgi:hypothetical protein
VRNGLTLNTGLRYDLQWLETIAIDRNNVSPRVGIAWSANSSMVIRGNVGRFYDRLPLRAVANALLSAGNTTDLGALRQTNVSLSPGQAGAPVFPAILDAAIPTTTLVTFTTMDRNIETAYSDKIGIELEKYLGGYTSFAAGYDWRSPSGYRKTFDAFETLVGFDRLKVMHLNDSKKPCGSRVDRHAHIGQGEVGTIAFRRLVNDPRVAHIGMVIETPKQQDAGEADPFDRENLRVLRGLMRPARRKRPC